jgi:hypothetical protein
MPPKFVAWDPSKRRYVSQYDNLAVTFNGNIIYVNENGPHDRNDLILLEYSGQSDSNGAPIYDGDEVLIITDDETTPNGEYEGTIWKVGASYYVKWLNKWDWLDTVLTNYTVKKVKGLYP